MSHIHLLLWGSKKLEDILKPGFILVAATAILPFNSLGMVVSALHVNGATATWRHAEIKAGGRLISGTSNKVVDSLNKDCTDFLYWSAFVEGKVQVKGVFNRQATVVLRYSTELPGSHFSSNQLPPSSNFIFSRVFQPHDLPNLAVKTGLFSPRSCKSTQPNTSHCPFHFCFSCSFPVPIHRHGRSSGRSNCGCAS